MCIYRLGRLLGAQRARGGGSGWGVLGVSPAPRAASDRQSCTLNLFVLCSRLLSPGRSHLFFLEGGGGRGGGDRCECLWDDSGGYLCVLLGVGGLVVMLTLTPAPTRAEVCSVCQVTGTRYDSIIHSNTPMSKTKTLTAAGACGSDCGVRSSAAVTQIGTES